MTTKGKPFKNQDYKKIRDECLSNGELFYDNLFKLDVPNAIWLRPKKINRDAQFFVGGASRFDVVQGQNSGCWLIVAMANLTLNPRLFEHVVPKGQNFTDDYAGIFRFNIWQCGKWVEVVVDDRLPTKNGQLMFVHSRHKNEFWSALLEKAYAKLYGSYNELTSGWFCEAMVDFTGGICERVKLTPEPPNNLGMIIRKSVEKSSFMCIFMKDDPSVRELIGENGLVKGHAYQINKTQTVHYRGLSLLLIRLRNPWGKIEWNGAWSDSSPEWASIPSDERMKIGLVSENDGEFWMSISDLAENFEYIDICHLTPNLFENFDSDKKIGFDLKMFEGDWIKNVNAGGFYSNTFYINPQYKITLNDSDDDADNLCTVIIGLMQRNKSRQVWQRIGFTAFPLKGPEKDSTKLSKEYINKNFEKSFSSKFRRYREVVVRDAWEPGVYCIMPSTYEPNEQSQFLLRVFSEKPATVEENEFVPLVARESIVSEPTEQIPKPKTKISRGKLLLKNDEELEQYFNKIAEKDKEIGWQGLQSVLEFALSNSQVSNEPTTGFCSMIINFISSLFSAPTKEKLFTKDECRHMIALLDDDRSGKMGLREFQILLKHLRDWELVFLNYSNETYYMDTAELNKALTEAGFQFRISDLSGLVRKYSDDNGKLAFDDFVMCAIEMLRTQSS